MTPDFTATSLDLGTGAITLSQADLEDIYTNKYDMINIHYTPIPGYGEMMFLYKKTAQTEISSPPMVRYDYTSTKNDNGTLKVYQLGFSVFYSAGSNPEYTITGEEVEAKDISSINGLAGGTLTSPLFITGGDSASAAKIALNESNNGQITNSSNATLFGFNSSNTLTVGAGSYNLAFRGNGTRPTYNNNDLALKSDITVTDVQNSSGTSVVTNGVATLPGVYAHHIYIHGASDDRTNIYVTLMTNFATLFDLPSFIAYINNLSSGSRIIAGGTIIYNKVGSIEYCRAMAAIGPGTSSSTITAVYHGTGDAGVTEMQLAQGTGTYDINNILDTVIQVI